MLIQNTRRQNSFQGTMCVCIEKVTGNRGYNYSQFTDYCGMFLIKRQTDLKQNTGTLAAKINQIVFSRTWHVLPIYLPFQISIHNIYLCPNKTYLFFPGHFLVFTIDYSSFFILSSLHRHRTKTFYGRSPRLVEVTKTYSVEHIMY